MQLRVIRIGCDKQHLPSLQGAVAIYHFASRNTMIVGSQYIVKLCKGKCSWSLNEGAKQICYHMWRRRILSAGLPEKSLLQDILCAAIICGYYLLGNNHQLFR